MRRTRLVYWLSVIALLFAGVVIVNKEFISQAQSNNITVSVYHLCTGQNNPINSGCDFAGDRIEDQNGSYILCTSNNDSNYACGTNGYPDNWSNPITLNLDDYCRDVVPNELGFGPLAAIQAQAIACRSHALSTSNWGQVPIDNSTYYQLYIPFSREGLTDQAVNTTANHYLTHDGAAALTEFSPDHIGTNMTNPGLRNEPYLISIYDPIDPFYSVPDAHGRGMAQLRAVNWGYGVNSGNNYYPSWDFRRILAHYYTDIEFQNVPNIRNDHRFNVIQISDLPEHYAFTPQAPSKNDITLILQNTGRLPWYPGQTGYSNCSDSNYNLSLSYHIYDNNNQIACGDPNRPGGNACFEGIRTKLCVPFAGAITPPGGSFIVSGVTVRMPSQLPLNRCYNLRWDIELHRNHTVQTWISRLQQTPWQAQWPTQVTRICYQDAPVAGDPDPPRNVYASSGHSVNDWDNNPAITVAWNPPNTPVSGYEYRYQGDGSNLTTGQWYSTGQTQASFVATQNGDHSLQVRSVWGSNESSYVEVGPYLIDQQDPSLTITGPGGNWVTTNNITLNWMGLDLDSGLSHYNVYYATNPGGPWTTLAQNTTSESVFITGSDDQTYHFRVIAYDNAENTTEKQKSVQVRTFPYLSVTPSPLNWTATLSDTAPSPRMLQILNNGGKVMTWTAQTNFPYLTLAANSGIDDSTMTITLTHPLTYGVYSGVLTITGTGDTRYSPAVIPITIRVVDRLDNYLPIIFK